jgi:nicotinamide-nucleotide amidase
MSVITSVQHFPQKILPAGQFNMLIQLLLTGNELMSGDTTDTNSVMVADQLRQLGLNVKRKVTVGDDIDLLIAQMSQQSTESDVLIINGGLGPTVDDLTAEALARTCSLSLTEHSLALEHLKLWCQARNAPLNDANLKQTLLPQDCTIIANPRGSAVGFRLRHNNCEIICTPGVPSELRHMLKESIIPLIESLASQQGHNERFLTKRIHTFGLGESYLQQLLIDTGFPLRHPVDIGFRAGAPTLEIKISGNENDIAAIELAETELRELISDAVTSEGDQSQARQLISILSERNQTLSTAESCTGGLISATLTAESGASAVFEAGFITYSNRIKSSMLGVKPETLERYGAVSEEVVKEMARGALEGSGSDYALAVSGIAGPEGGSEDKPTGTVCIAWGDHSHLQCTTLLYPYSRKLFQTMVTGAALDLIRRHILDIKQTPHYVERHSRSVKP